MEYGLWEMNKILKFYPKNAAENPDSVLEQAVGTYNSVMVIGWDKEDCLDVRTSTNITQAELLWMIEKFKLNLIDGVFDEE